jgi:hypothetical protein
MRKQYLQAHASLRECGARALICTPATFGRPLPMPNVEQAGAEPQKSQRMSRKGRSQAQWKAGLPQSFAAHRYRASGWARSSAALSAREIRWRLWRKTILGHLSQ